MPLGAQNPLPFRIGPGPTPTQRIYNALRSAQGRTNSGASAAGPEGGLRDLWTLCVARAIARSGTVERALAQFWPATMTSGLDYWEPALGLSGSNLDLGTRQQNVANAIAAQLDATVPGLRTSLAAIHPSLNIAACPWQIAQTTEPGKAFGPLPGVAGPAFFTGQAAARGQIASQWPNYGSGFIINVVYYPTIQNPIPPTATVQAVTALMTTTLPSWITWILSTIVSGPSGDGFYFDGGPAGNSLMDVTAFDP